MQAPRRPKDELQRLEALRRYRVLDTLPDQALDDLTALAAHIVRAPISLISLVDSDRQWFKSKVGVAFTETARAVSFCGHAINDRGLFIVPDAELDPRFHDNPLVTGPEHVRFYAGAPLIAPDGHALGTLCVMDREPRTLSAAEQDALQALGRQVMAQLELGRQTRELADSEARLRLVTDNARIGLVMVDQERRYVYSNRTYSEILGLPPGDLVGQRVAEVMPDLYAEQISPRLDQAFAGERVAYELRRPVAGGEQTYLVRYEPTTTDATRALVVVVISDITDRRKTEELLRVSHERFQLVTRATNDAVWDWDLRSNALAWNEGFQSRFGYAPAEVDPTVASWSSAIHPEDQERVLTGIRGVVTSQGNAWSDEYRFRRRDGTYAEVLDRGYVIRDPRGTPLRMVGAMQDITERVQADIAARRFAAIVESSHDAIIGKDLNGIITSWNSGAERIFGYPAAEIVGTPIARLIPDDRHGEELQILSRIRRGESVRHFETVRRTRDGRAIDVSITASPIKDTAGRVIGASKVARDITEGKRAEAAVRAAGQLLADVINSTPSYIFATDRQHRYTLVNDAYTRFVHRPASEIVGYTHHDVFPAATADSFVAVNDEIMTSGEGRQIEEIVSGAALVTTKFPMRDAHGVVTGLVGVVTDITERDRAVAALRVTEERMRFALESADVGIWDIDFASGVLRWSETLEAQFGLAPGTFEGTFDAFLTRLHPDDRPTLSAVFQQASADGQDFSVQHRAVRPDGTVRWLTGTGRVHLDAAGRPVRGVGISMDVTERRTLEAQYQQAQKMEAIGRLAGGIAHDFNSLLTAILGHCELVQADLDAANPGHESLVQIQKAGVSAAALTQQLLAFSRKQIVEHTRLDLNHVISDTRQMLGRLIGEDVKVVLRPDPKIVPVMADRGQIQQVVMNLAVNARDAMPMGGTLTVETANVSVDDTYAATHLPLTPGAYVVLTVTDTGTGMTPDVQARLFEPFFTTKAVGKGTGLGLATVHGIVARSGGCINVYSEVGLGTAIAVYLPQAPLTAQEARPAPAAPRSLGGSETVLVVEDADALRDLTRELLSRQGYQVLVAANAQEALRHFDTGATIDVLLTDVVMPGASGPQLTRELLKRLPNLKVIYMSGYTDEAITHHGVLTPGTAFLQKPFTSEALGRKVRDVLDQ